MLESCVRRIQFCYGHRVMGHENKCSTLHGHNGVVFIHAAPIKKKDAVGRVIDFSVLKDLVGGWIDENWDHTMILNKEDVETINLIDKAPKFKQTFILPYNPTAENLAQYLLFEVCPKILKKQGIVVYKITFHETENCYAQQELSINDELIEMYS